MTHLLTSRVPLAVRLSNSHADTYITPRLRSLRYRSAVPGGFASLSTDLYEPLSGAPPELEPFTHVVVYDTRSAEVMWQGRLEDPARGSDASGQVWQLQALGPSAHAKDRKVPLVYIDRQFQGWQLWSAPIPNSTVGVQPVPDRAPVVPPEQALVLHIPKGATVPQFGHVEVMYMPLRASGQFLARIDFDWDAGLDHASWRAIVRVGANPDETIYDVASSTTAVTDQALIRGSHFTTDQTHPTVKWQWNGAAAEQTVESGWLAFPRLVIQALRKDKAGVDLTAAADYEVPTSRPRVLAHQVVADLLGRLLPHFDGPNAVIDMSGDHQFDQLAWLDGVTAADVLAELMKFETSHYWAAWEAPEPGGRARFEYVRWPSQVRYEAGGDRFSSPASTAELYNRVRVRYTRPGGDPLYVSLSAPVRELDEAGIVREGFEDLGGSTGSTVAATRRGEEFLQEHSSPSNAGSLTIDRPIYDAELGRVVQPWELRPGGLVKVTGVQPRPDALNPSQADAVTVFKGVSTEFDSDSVATTVALDSEPASVATLLAATR